VTDITLLIPTLNEEENIDLLMERVLSVLRSSPFAFNILFIDSASTDKTCAKVKSWTQGAPVQLLSRDVNVGLASAVIAGAKQTQARFVAVMDADLSHPPEDIPRLLAPLLGGDYDMVLGSRYIAGGSVPDWRMRRRVSSKLATLPALLFCDVKDPLAGFFALERRWLTQLPVDVPGFKVALAVLSEYRERLRVKEIPIVFQDRNLGDSKMSSQVVFDYIRQLGLILSRRVRIRTETL
jgi:dolichol-phosphate mannosyltransferase